MDVGCRETSSSTDFGGVNGIPRDVTTTLYDEETLMLSRIGSKTRNGPLGSHQGKLVCRICFDF